ncbi:hypothetical protein GC163_00705 [bacterium]|nr:hypothetical protein [bacterium]
MTASLPTRIRRCWMPVRQAAGVVFVAWLISCTANSQELDVDALAQVAPAPQTPLPPAPAINTAPPASGPAIPPPQAPATTVGLFNRLFANNSLTPSPQKRNTSLRQLSESPMFGDNQDAACGAVELLGIGVLAAEHPALGCFRLNISENNTPVPTDRVYFRYNHLHNSLNFDVTRIIGKEDGLYNLNVDRFIWGMEKTLFDGRASVEVRIPTSYEITPDPSIYVTESATNLPYTTQEYVLKNIGMIYKSVLYETPNFLISAGVAVDMPTAPGLDLDVRVQDTFPFTHPNVPPPYDTPLNFSGNIYVENSTVNISPLLAMGWTPTDRTFVQGFIQYDVPVNPTRVDGVIVTKPVDPNSNADDFRSTDSSHLYQQDLLRLNLGAGFAIWKARQGRITDWRISSELHYTTTLENARNAVLRAQFVNPADPNQVLPLGLAGDITIGNVANRVDVLNYTLGNTFVIRERTSIGTGFAVPLRTAADKRFDCEFILQINHLY